MQHALQCRCGTLKGWVDADQGGNRGVCYCKDCQAFAHFLGSPQEILDMRGGTEVIQVLPKQVSFTQGVQSLVCMRLTERGLLRWYAACCRTPIGNTLYTPKLAFVGLVHNCLEHAQTSLDASFGPVRAHFNTQSAKGAPKPKASGIARAIAWFLSRVLPARFNGNYKRTPFFNAAGSPVVTPQVLSGAERTELMNTVNAAAA